MWILANKKLPESHTEVLVYARKEDVRVFAACYFSGGWHRSSSGNYAPLDDFYGDGEIKVTHWMPLPEPPERTKSAQSGGQSEGNSLTKVG